MNVFISKKTRIVFTLDVANIYKSPGVNYPIIRKVEPATDVRILGSEGDWYYVEVQTADKPKGYIRKELVFE